MSGHTGFPISASASLSGFRALAPRVEKSYGSNGLHGERRGDERSASSNEEQNYRAPLSRFETLDSAPLWHGPRLRAAFVAQILGQVFADTTQSRSELAGYQRRTQRLYNLALDELA